MKPPKTSTIVCGLLFLLAAASMQGTERRTVTEPMIGHWEGNAHIVVAWCHQKTLQISLEIHPDDSVTGQIGDASLRQGRFARNRGSIGRTLNLKTDYIIIGDLTGPIIASEQITRSRVSIPLNFQNGTFAGGLHTSGSKFGGKGRMILSASSLALKKPPPPEKGH